MSNNVLRMPAVIQKTGLSRAAIYRRLSADFPKPIYLGPRAVGWLESEIDDWIRCCVERSRPSSQRPVVKA